MTPQRIQRKRTKGWRMPEGAVYVGRLVWLSATKAWDDEQRGWQGVEVTISEAGS